MPRRSPWPGDRTRRGRGGDRRLRRSPSSSPRASRLTSLSGRYGLNRASTARNWSKKRSRTSSATSGGRTTTLTVVPMVEFDAPDLAGQFDGLHRRHAQLTGAPVASAIKVEAALIGIANPRPSAWVDTAVLTPMTAPDASSNGPPLLPGLIAASVWSSPLRVSGRPVDSSWHRDRPAGGRDDPARHRFGEGAERAADRDGGLAHLEPGRITDLRGGQAAGVDLDQGEVLVAGDPDHGRIELPAVGELDGQRLAALDDVTVRQDVPVRGQDDPRADAGRRDRQQAAGRHAFGCDRDHRVSNQRDHVGQGGLARRRRRRSRTGGRGDRAGRRCGRGRRPVRAGERPGHEGRPYRRRPGRPTAARPPGPTRSGRRGLSAPALEWVQGQGRPAPRGWWTSQSRTSDSPDVSLVRRGLPLDPVRHGHLRSA